MNQLLWFQVNSIIRQEALFITRFNNPPYAPIHQKQEMPRRQLLT
ncbi:hypothetical protein [Legionella clemsonensis]|nr:hypothetical protein [Legionella clemsonensis]